MVFEPNFTKVVSSVRKNIGITQSVIELKQQLQAKEQECERLKESVSELITMKEEDIKRINNAIKLKQTLSEIKQLSDRIVNSDDLLLWDVYELNEQINQKIREVLDVEND